ncbi:terpenoid synthase [Auriscalpium vulgare]|uniref:Terpenoid synthase n=1 Tax=Auriscalpium vulgare TaxID=40419 RepID=A0ACB8RBR1_9AGAM|nr:terpenoid synthase [Auriscalpium vulgare]
MQSPTQASYRLPETLAGWPWPRMINPHYEEVKAESRAWFHSFRAFGPKSQDAFDKCDFWLLASLSYPFLDKARLRTGCDLMMLFFVFDEYTDLSHGDDVRVYADMVMDALRNPHTPRPAGEILLGEVARQFWELAVKTATPTAQKRFIDAFTRYTDSVVAEARDRDETHVRSIDEYFKIRRFTIGAEPSYVPMELAMDIPDDVIAHPTVVKLTQLVTDVILLDNDLCSYNKEQANGEELHNILTIVMAELKVDLNGALDWLEKRHAELNEAIIETCNSLPVWNEDIRDDVDEYLLGVVGWVRSNDSWNFESQRYFGTDGLDTQKHRMVTMRPKKAGLGCPVEGDPLQELMV